MTRSLGASLPSRLVERLGQRDPAAHLGVALPFVTVDGNGRPHPMLLSYLEVRAYDARTVGLVIGGRSRSAQNLAERRAGTLLVIEPDATVYVKLRAVDGPLPVDGGGEYGLGYFLLEVEEVLEDAAADWEGGMRITGGVRYPPPRSAGSPGMTSRTSTPRGSRSLSRSRSSSVTSAMDTPSQPQSTLPFAASCGMICLTRFAGIAKPIEPLRAAMLLTPITSPAVFTSGPPEFPGLIAASVWMKSKPGAATTRGAPLRLTMPNDTLCSRPNGWPSASTNSPTRSRFESPSGSTVRFVAPSILIRARSTRVSRPVTFPAQRRPSESRTWIVSAPSTT